MKRKFKIVAAGYGGEYAICTKSVDFVEKWQDADEQDLIEEVQDTFYDEADLEHIHGARSDESKFTVYEIKDGEEVEIDDELEIYSFMGREAYYTDSDNGSVPVLSFYSSEKGIFCSWELETENFNPELLATTVVETDMGEFIQDLYYDGKKLEADDSCVDTIGKGYFAKVAWVNPEWHETSEKFENKEFVKENWGYHLETL